MSKQKPWPTVANRHRINGIFKAGELSQEAEKLLNLLPQLREAITEGNIALSLAIVSAIEGRAKFIKEAAQTIGNILETAPSEDKP